MIHAHYDEHTKEVIGWYLPITKNIPHPTIEISDELHMNIINRISEGDFRAVVVGKDIIVVKKENNTTWGDIRNKRNRLLKQTDFTQLGDFPEDKSNKYKIYREKLRNIPQKYSKPGDVVWPTL